MSVAIETLLCAVHDPESRGQAIRSLVDMFLAVDAPASTQEKDLLSDIVDRVIDDYSFEVRQELSHKLAPSERTPQKLARQLANDAIDIARPILEQSPVLDDNDLIEITNQQGDEYRLAIASRRTLTERVTDSLVTQGGLSVIRQVTSNEGAALSSYGVSTIVERAEGDEQVYSSLGGRKNLSHEAASTLSEMVGNILLDRLQDVDPNATIEALTNVAMVRIEKEMKEKKRARLKRKILISEINKGDKQLDEVILSYCSIGRVDELSVILAELSDLPEGVVENIMRADDPAMMMVLCRFFEVGREAFAALTQAYCDRKGQSLGYVRKLLDQYHHLEGSEARRTITLIKLHQRVDLH